MALKPLHDRVLVRRVESDEKTSGGLIIPESAKEKIAKRISNEDVEDISKFPNKALNAEQHAVNTRHGNREANK